MATHLVTPEAKSSPVVAVGSAGNDGVGKVVLVKVRLEIRHYVVGTPNIIAQSKAVCTRSSPQLHVSHSSVCFGNQSVSPSALGPAFKTIPLMADNKQKTLPLSRVARSSCAIAVGRAYR